MRNVRERMQVLYGDSAEVEIESRPGRGTKVTLRMPVIEGEGGGWGAMREAVEGAVRGLRR
jgi:two-component system LytT family sensor kinase